MNQLSKSALMLRTEHGWIGVKILERRRVPGYLRNPDGIIGGKHV
jgi:hypothetical protein